MGDLREIWTRGVVTNGGPVQLAFEEQLRCQLGWSDPVVVSSGSMALSLLCSAARLEGEVLVSGFTHAATIQALVSRGLTPVPVDIEPASLTMEPAAAAQRLTSKTSGLLVTHTFGYPADMDELEAIARANGLVLLFDAAAAVGVLYRGRPLADFGDGSAFSFHATKLMSTLEGGAVASRRPEIASAIRALRNFGMSDAEYADPWGANGKASELVSAIGLRSLPGLAREIVARGNLLELYRAELDESWAAFAAPRDNTDPNNSYCCIRLRSRADQPLASTVEDVLRSRGIQSRRYFAGRYTTALPDGLAPEAERAREDVLCLPLWGAMPEAFVRRVCNAVRQAVADAA